MDLILSKTLADESEAPNRLLESVVASTTKLKPHITVKLLNILSVLKITRILRFTKVITFLSTSDNVKLSLRLAKLIFYLLIYIHWQACAWFYYTK
jgi:Ion transport protein